ncbi:cytochrome P450 [Mycena filopes]|nr:cytochrome P450 [Mycena filopes]
MVDIVIYSSFGYDSGAVQKWTVNAVDHISDAITDFPKMAILSSLVPAWVWSALCQIPHERLKRFTRTSHILKEFVAHRIQEVHELEGTEESETATLIQRLLQDRKNTSKKALAVPLATSESVAHLIAGSETSSMTLAYLLWQLTRSPEVHIKLRAEVDDTMPDSRSIPDLGILQELPYLNAFIQEGMRVHSVVPALLERIVPPGPDFQLREYAIPPGTVVGTQAWSVHKSDDVFPSPERFDPERWLDETSDGATTRLAHLMPFGLGTRICVGRPLAESALRIAITALVRNFIITADASTTEESMEMKHGFANFPASGEWAPGFPQSLL